MKHIRQKPYECFPTVLAMLLDKPVVRVKREIQGKQLAGYEWSLLNTRADKGKQLTRQVEAYLHKHLPWMTLESYVTESPLGADPRRFDLPIGRGVLVINRHIVAFENGVVFDPGTPAPIDWQEYRVGLVKRNKSINLMEVEPC